MLFWICIHYDSRNKMGEVKRRIIRQYKNWNFLSTERLTRGKAGQISNRLFRTVDIYFTDYCKPLVNCLRELHQVTFPGGAPQLQEDYELYPQIVAVLEKARKDLRKLQHDSIPVHSSQCTRVKDHRCRFNKRFEVDLQVIDSWAEIRGT